MQVLFSFDTTGSMYSALAELRRKLSGLVEELFTTIPDLQIGMIAHGDYNDHPYAIKTLEFTNDKNKLVQFVNTVEPTNGFGNGGEQYEMVLNVARNFAWDGDKKIFVMIGDEPAHLVNSRIYSGGKYLEVDKDYQIEARALVANGVDCYIVRALNRMDSRGFHRTLSTIFNKPIIPMTQLSDMAELFVAFIYHGANRLEEYAEQTKPTMTRNVAAAIDALLGKIQYSDGVQSRTVQQYNTRVNKPTTQYTGKYQLSDKLVPVDPARFQRVFVETTMVIKPFVETMGIQYRKGQGYYLLTKPELVQEYKTVVLRDKITGDMWTGKEARDIIGLPYGQRGTIHPLDHLPYDVYIQSTSVNRKLTPNSWFLYEGA